MPSSEFVIQSTVFNRKRLLKIVPEYLSFEEQGPGADPEVFPVADIEAFRYGVSWISGWHFVIGRTYFMDVRNSENRTIRIRLRSLYGIRKKALGRKFNRMLNALISTYFNELALHYVRLLQQGMSFELSGLPVSPEGVWLSSVKQLVPWNRMAIHRYASYFSLSDKDHPDRYRILHYGYDWNAAVLLGVAEHESERVNTIIR